MKRWVWLLCGILLMGAGGKQGVELENLKPVSLLEVRREDGIITLRTDTGDYGTGKTWQAALKDMEETSTGMIFMETADFLLLCENTDELLPEICEKLRPAIRVCKSERKIDPQSAAEFLSAHPPCTTLGAVFREGKEPARLLKEGGRLKIDETPGKNK